MRNFKGLPCGFLGLSESEIERYGASFVRFKDPDGPEMHKARKGVLPDHGFGPVTLAKMKELHMFNRNNIYKRVIPLPCYISKGIEKW